MQQPILSHAVLTGERVNLRPVCAADAATAFGMLHGEQRILRWLVWDGPESVEELEQAYGQWVHNDGRAADYHFAICEAETGAFAGCIGPRFMGHPGQGDVGYWLAPRFWGRGFMTEALKLVNHLCFEHLEAAILYAYVFVGNEGSRKALQRAGYDYLHLSRGQTVKGGQPVDEWYFTALRQAWRGRQGGWQPRQVVVELTG